MLPKLHKSKKTNEIIEIKLTEYIQIDEDILVEGSWSCFSHKWNIRNFTFYYGTCFIFNPTHCYRLIRFYAEIRETMSKQ